MQSVELRPGSPAGGSPAPPAPTPSVPSTPLTSTSAVNFVHPYTGDTPLHCAAGSVYPKRKQVIIIAKRCIFIIKNLNKNNFICLGS